MLDDLLGSLRTAAAAITALDERVGSLTAGSGRANCWTTR